MLLRKATLWAALLRQPFTGPAQSETLCMRENSPHGNREIPRIFIDDGKMERSEKAGSRTSDMHIRGKSDGPIVPKKSPNKSGGDAVGTSLAEAVEGRGPTKGNTRKTSMPRTQSRTRMSNGLERVRESARREGKPESFDFLGFTHLCGRKLKDKSFILKRKTTAKRLRVRFQEVKVELMRRRHEPVDTIGAWLRSVMRGYFNYHAVPGNMAALETFRREICRYWLHALRRRSQRHRMNWERFGRIIDRWIPKLKILHPHPSVRFYAKHPR